MKLEAAIPMDNDTDSQIVNKNMQQELQQWIEELNYILSEADRLAKISSNKIGDKILRDAILDNSNEAIVLSNELFNYRNTLANYRECDDLECDLYYKHLHYNIYQKYAAYIKAYRVLKEDVYLQLLM